jgi:hypothetical protein
MQHTTASLSSESPCSTLLQQFLEEVPAVHYCSNSSRKCLQHVTVAISSASPAADVYKTQVCDLHDHKSSNLSVIKLIYIRLLYLYFKLQNFETLHQESAWCSALHADVNTVKTLLYLTTTLLIKKGANTIYFLILGDKQPKSLVALKHPPRIPALILCQTSNVTPKCT